jgi:hypothetical protein
VPSRGLLYGTVVALVALLIIASGLAAVYYGQYQRESSQSQKYVEELDTALQSYASLESSFNSSLRDYGFALSLLTGAVANLNTSTPEYQNASAALSSLWSSYQALSRESGHRALVFEVHVFVDFGNGTRRWYNDTTIQPGWNGYIATLVLFRGDVQAIWYPPGYFLPGEPGEHFVTGIGGISNTQTEFWALWTYNDTSFWQVSQVGADLIPMLNGTVFAWTYCGVDASYYPTCPP